MSTLVAITYPDTNTLQRATAKLGQLQQAHLIEISDAVYVTKNEKGKMKLHQAVNTAGAGAASGALWGLLFGLLFLMPVVGLAVGAASGALAGALSDYGIDDKFIKQIAAELQPGNGVLLLMIESATVDKVTDAMKEYGGKIVYSNLSKEQEELLKSSLQLDEAQVAQPEEEPALA